MIQRDIDKVIALKCRELGFKKKKCNYYKPLTYNVMATIGIGSATFRQNGHYFINVTIGVFYKDVDEFYSKLTGYSAYEYMQPTIGTQIGYLMPINDFYEWDIVEGVDNSVVFDDIFINIKKYGFPYQVKMSDFDNMFDAFYRRDRGILNISREKILPILYYMKGEKEKGIEFIQETIKRRSRRPTDDELLAGRDKAKTIILRAGEEPKLTAANMDKMLRDLPSGGSIEIVGPGCNGVVDPLYLEFAKRYELLP